MALVLICHDIFIVVVLNNLLLSRLLEVLRLLHFAPAPLAAGIVTPLTFFPPSLWMSWVEKKTRKHQRKSDSTMFSQGKRQGQTAEFEINQILALSTGATFRLWLRFDLGSSFQWVLTSQSCEESRPGSYSGGFSDTVFTRHEEVGALQQTAPYSALSIISHSIHENRNTAGSTVWTAKL